MFGCGAAALGQCGFDKTRSLILSLDRRTLIQETFFASNHAAADSLTVGIFAGATYS
jgi:hypothetical protein